MISVIIPCYNSNDLVNEAIDSCFNFGGVDERELEIIVVDDHSKQPVKTFLKNKTSVKCIRNKANLGPAASRNIGIRLSKGDYIAFLDADDLVINNRFKKQINLIEKDESNFVISAIKELGIKGNENEIIFDVPDKSEDWVIKIFEDKIYSVTPTILFKRSILRNVGYMDEELRHFEDKDFLLRVIEKYPISYVREPLLMRRVFESGTSRSIDEQTFLKSRNDFLIKAVERFEFLKSLIPIFWANQYRGLGRLLLLSGDSKRAYFYFKKSIRAKFNIKSMIYLSSFLLPPLRDLIKK